MQNPTATAAKYPPYFDVLLHHLRKDDPVTRVAFGRHVHWGYWTDPEGASGTAEDYADAAETLCRHVCDAAEPRDGLRILDVGCGFGGTIASLNERFSNLELVGVNIDPRQLERARAEVKPRNGNRITFVEANACQLPFPDRSFDIVLAVECIFHFPSRADFFAHASRVLVPGGKLALSDFVPESRHLRELQQHDPGNDQATKETYGKIDVLCTSEQYRALAEENGLTMLPGRDITTHTLPTYPFLRHQHRSWPEAMARSFSRATTRLEAASRMGWLYYMILRFGK